MNAPLPPPPVWPTLHPLGHLPGFIANPLALMTEAHQRYGEIVQVRAFTQPCVFVASPTLARQVLVGRAAQYTKDTPGYRVLSLVLGKGLVTAEGEPWRRHRRMANPAFRRTCLEGFARTFNEATEDAVGRWSSRAGAPLDLHEEMTRLTLRIAGETLFGVDLADETASVSRAVTESLEGFDRLVVNPLPFAHRIPTPANRRMKAALVELNRVVVDIIRHRRSSGEDVPDLLGMLLAAYDEETDTALDDNELRDEILTMLTAGHETTANALSWTLWELGRNPEWASRAAEEVRAVAPTGPVTFQHLAQMPVLQQIFQESLRLHPPVWTLERRCTTGDLLGGYRVAPDALVFVNTYGMHRSPALWEAPTTFDPGRWSPERKKTHVAGAYLPFSTGGRKCIGDRFADAESRIVLAHLLRSFRVELAQNCAPTPIPSVTLRPGGGVPARLVPLA